MDYKLLLYFTVLTACGMLTPAFALCTLRDIDECVLNLEKINTEDKNLSCSIIKDSGNCLREFQRFCPEKPDLNNRIEYLIGYLLEQIRTICPVDDKRKCEMNLQTCMENYDRYLPSKENGGMNMESICRELPNAIECVEGAADSCKTEFEQKMYNRTISSLRMVLEPCKMTDGPLTTDLSTSDHAVCTLYDFYTCIKNLSQIYHQRVYEDACKAFTDTIVCSSRLNKLCTDVLFLEEQIHYLFNELNTSVLVYLCTYDIDNLLKMQMCFSQVESYDRSRLGPEIYKEEICRALPSVKRCVHEARGKSDDGQLDQEIFGWITSRLAAFDRNCGEVVSEKTKTVNSRRKVNSPDCKEVQQCVDKFERYRQSLNNKTITKEMCRKFRAHKRCVKKASSSCKNKTLINKAKEDIQSAKTQCFYKQQKKKKTRS